MECFVCHAVLDGDEAYIAVHLNRCLDSSSSSEAVADPSGESSSAASTSRAARAQSSDSDSDDGFEIVASTLPKGKDKEGAGKEMARDGRRFKRSSSMTSMTTAAAGGATSSSPKASSSSAATSASPPPPKKAKVAEDETPLTHDKDLKLTEGLVALLGGLLETAHAGAGTKVKRAIVGVKRTVFIRNHWADKTWGCGFRNLQMLFSAMMELDCYAPVWKGGIPSILEIQTAIERAWQSDYDPSGAADFNGKLAGRRKWIGTTEVYTYLTWRGVRCRIIDFPKKEQKKGAVLPAALWGGFGDGQEQDNGGIHVALTRWIYDYFTTGRASRASSGSSGSSSTNAFSHLLASSGTSITYTSKQPLYLQHQGHSRLVVGIEVLKEPSGHLKAGEVDIKGMAGGDANLLVLDPAKPVPTLLLNAADPEAASKVKPVIQAKAKAYAAFFATAPKGAASTGKTDAVEAAKKAHKALLPFYRVSMGSLGRRDEYQILYVEDPEETGGLLSWEEQQVRKYVVSTQVR